MGKLHKIYIYTLTLYVFIDGRQIFYYVICKHGSKMNNMEF